MARRQRVVEPAKVVESQSQPVEMTTAPPEVANPLKGVAAEKAYRDVWNRWRLTTSRTERKSLEAELEKMRPMVHGGAGPDWEAFSATLR